MKKYIILVAAAIVACAACSKVETLGEKNEIRLPFADREIRLRISPDGETFRECG